MSLHVAITGASSGIGESIARAWGRTGAQLTLVARRQAALEKLAGEFPGQCQVFARDLAQSTVCCDWLAPAQDHFGPVDVLVNNAGVENTGPTALANVDQAIALLHLNLHTPLLLTRALLPAMLARGSGTIVDVASVAGLVPTPMQTWYGASKAGLAAFSEALRGEVRGSGVHVVTVYPGPVTTAMAEAAYEKFGGRSGLVGMVPEGTADELAELILDAVERKRPRVIYPRFYAAMRWVPWLGRMSVDAQFGGTWKGLPSKQ
ncbi:MAG: SDR family NAD(P)-dependent oxidoreductase [Myxococcales bacterium]|nr:SDR family NAD(P)-dependent oxidoreductase [Myxococcales bacterium]